VSSKLTCLPRNLARRKWSWLADEVGSVEVDLTIREITVIENKAAAADNASSKRTSAPENLVSPK
jgi:hypothetical protein